MNGSNKDVDLDYVNAGDGKNKVDFGDVDSGVDNNGGDDDTNCRYSDSRTD